MVLVTSLYLSVNLRSVPGLLKVIILFRLTYVWNSTWGSIMRIEDSVSGGLF